MEIRVLRYFLAVAREETISGAAEALHVTQPTLSRQLMEADLIDVYDISLIPVLLGAASASSSRLAAGFLCGWSGRWQATASRSWSIPAEREKICG